MSYCLHCTSNYIELFASDALSMLYQGDEVGGSKKRCLLTLNFDNKKSQSEAERTFDCHILAPIKQ